MFIAASGTQAFAQIDWSNQSPSGLTDDVWCVTYANGTFAATTSQGRILTSTDGLTWSSQTVSQGTWLVSIAYGNGTWVAVGAGGTILVSSDLKTWLSAKSVTSNRLNGVLYNGAVWLAVGEAGTIATSPDALNWTVQPIPASLSVTGFLHGITWDPVNSVFFVSGQANATQPIDTGGRGVLLILSISGNSVTMSLGITANNPLEAVLYESGLSPNTVTVGDGGAIISGNYAAAGGGTGAVPNVIYRGLAYGNGYWTAAGEQGTIVTSTDGLIWTQRFSGTSPSTLSTAVLLGATYSPTLQRFVITGTSGTILVSNAIPAVFANVSTRGLVNASQNLIGGFVIQGTSPRTVLVRADGPILSTYGVASPLPDPVLTVYNASGVVVGTNTGWATNTTPSSITTAALQVGAFPVPSSSLDSALLLTLQPGAYTAVITTAKGNTGTALFEAYTD